MTTASAIPARKFKPIFNVTVTPATIEHKAGKSGDYTLLRAATVERAGREPKKMVLMAFGPRRDAVLDLLVEGTPVELAVRPDGGTLVIVGPPAVKAA